MFSNKEVISSFEGDGYGFTQHLTFYINNHDLTLSQGLTEDIDGILSDAYDKSMPEALKVVQNALFMIYQINLCYPLSIPASLQHDEVISVIRRKIEAKWLSAEFAGHTSNCWQDDNFAEFLVNVWQGHAASHHPLFEYLEKDATAEQLYLFLKSDSALNLIFFDLVSHTLIGAMPETRGTISENIWDEIGHGDNYFTHVNLYKNVLERQGIQLPENHYIDLYGADALTGHNAFLLGCVNRSHYYKLLGVMAMTELLDPPQYSKLIKGCSRLGLTDRDFHYYSEHITIDVKHGEDWLYKVIKVITDQHPDSKKSFT